MTDLIQPMNAFQKHLMHRLSMPNPHPLAMPSRTDLEPLQTGDVVKRMPLIVIDRAGKDGRGIREFWTDDGLCLGSVREHDPPRPEQPNRITDLLNSEFGGRAIVSVDGGDLRFDRLEMECDAETEQREVERLRVDNARLKAASGHLQQELAMRPER